MINHRHRRSGISCTLQYNDGLNKKKKKNKKKIKIKKEEEEEEEEEE